MSELFSSYYCQNHIIFIKVVIISMAIIFTVIATFSFPCHRLVLLKSIAVIITFFIKGFDYLLHNSASIGLFFNQYPQIDHFTVVCLVAWLLSESEAGVDVVLIETSLLFLCKSLLISMRAAH